jgi:hypothetical protein
MDDKSRRRRQSAVPLLPSTLGLRSGGLQDPAEGLLAGILIPEAGRGRRHALKQLRELAEQNGFPVASK